MLPPQMLPPLDTEMVLHLQVPAYRMMVAHDLVRN